MVAFSLLRYNFFHIPTQFLEETWAATCEWNIVYGDTAEYLKSPPPKKKQKLWGWWHTEMEVFKVGIFQFVFVDLGMTFSEALITLWLYNFLVTLVLDFFQVKVK